jgi:hypothetical protein
MLIEAQCQQRFRPQFLLARVLDNTIGCMAIAKVCDQTNVGNYKLRIRSLLWSFWYAQHRFLSCVKISGLTQQACDTVAVYRKCYLNFSCYSALRCEIEKWKLNVKLRGYNVKTECETEMLQSHWLCANAATLAPMIGVFFKYEIWRHKKLHNLHSTFGQIKR